MQVLLLLGPAGSGKTFRCLAEIRTALREDTSPDAPQLILLAPKQATFQLERQLLADPELSGYSRLHIFSFDRLAQFVLEKLSAAPVNQLNEEGRVMVLRALLLRHEEDLKLFRQSARRPGFAQELSQLLNELQQHQFTPAKLRDLIDRFARRPELQGKLHDLALLDDAFSHWLAEHKLQDANHLLDFAIAALRRTTHNLQHSTLHFGHLWFDGFAEMTPQELDLLAMLLPCCEQATLAFCLETRPEIDAQPSWLSIWSTVAKTYQQCRQRVENLPDCRIEIEVLPRDPKGNRFAGNSALVALEKNWARPIDSLGSRSPTRHVSRRDQRAGSETGIPAGAIRIVTGLNPEAEAVFAAREVLKFVRAGNRFRDCAMLVRNLENYHKPLARAFRRYEIPFFLDRREAVAHHPLAELTRSAVRTVAFDWQQDDWFAALKAGFLPVNEADIDRLENAALEFGWHGKKWFEPLPEETCERLRRKILPPFAAFAAHLAQGNNQPNGAQLAEALGELWQGLDVEPALEKWSLPAFQDAPLITRHPSLHSTVWERMNRWLENIALAFKNEKLSLRDWLPVLEAGLANLTVGVVPPALDQVLIGAVDRARNPDLKLAIVLGVNEGMFPATPAAPPILTRADREELEECNVTLGPSLRDQLAREQYLGYIGCTRASERLLVSFSRQDADGKTLNPSSLITHLQTLFPKLEIQAFHADANSQEAEHISELIVPLVESESPLPAKRGKEQGEDSMSDFAHCTPEPGRADLQVCRATDAVRREGQDKNWSELLKLPALESLAENLRQLREPDPKENLSPVLADAIYGPTLKTSVSRLEEFAQCPFRFFVHSGLRAEERKVFELDARERGSFQHEVLKLFHEQLKDAGKRWRDLTPTEARQRVGRIAAELAPNYRDGLLRADDQGRFTARVLAGSLQDFVETLVTWMRGQYEFDPVVAESGFGFDEAGMPAWEMDLGNRHRLALRGRIDRIDLCRETADSAFCVVMDYKSGQRKLDIILAEHGVQLQLLGYLAAVRRWPSPRELFSAGRLVPAGVFYVNLRGKYEGGATRTEALADTEASRRMAYRHTGRFSKDALSKLDRRPDARTGDQFNYRRNQDGSLHKGSVEALPRTAFEALLDRVETQLMDMGRAVFAGAASVDPYRKGSQTPCEYCDYRSVCRIDPWTHRYRILRAMPKKVEA